MRWPDLADTVARHAPLLSAALRSRDASATPVHALVASITGTAPDDPAAAAAAIAADPTLLERLRAAEAQSRADLVAYVLRMNGSAATGPVHDTARAQPGFWKNLGLMRYAAHMRNRDRQRSKYFFMRPLLSAAVLVATIVVVFIVLLGFADHALHDPTIAATAGCVLMYFMSEARLVTAYWFGATHESRDANALARLVELRGRREGIEGIEGIEGREVVAREVEEFAGEREVEEKLLERSRELPAERAAAELFELRTPRL
jgi:hypothetical protein